MTFWINRYDQSNPVMEIDVGDRRIEFSLSKVSPQAHEWLGEVLDRQINELVERRVREALDAHKKALRDLLGAQP